MKKIVVIIFVATVFGGFLVVSGLNKKTGSNISSFEDCMTAGSLVMESYPRRCRAGGQTFTENIGNELEKADLIRLSFPRPNDLVSSPLILRGKARGSWFFEASFPVVLTDGNGKIIAEGQAISKEDWMTDDFVPFESTLDFKIDKNAPKKKGNLILKKDNPSGLPVHDDALEVPVRFGGVSY